MAEPTHRHAYIARINRVVDHIAAHLAQPLDLQALAEVAHFSPWHFHRMFQGAMGETLADCVRRLRLEAAAKRLLETPPPSALSVALDVGFASAEVFTRAFKAHFGMTPSAWRRGGSRAWAQSTEAQLRKIHQAQRKHRQDAGTPAPEDQGFETKGLVMKIALKTLPPMRLAYMRYTGPYGSPGINETWQRFMPWCSAHAAELVSWETYGISQDNPSVTPPEKCRYDCAVQVKDSFKPQGEIGVQQFDGGQYACAEFTGTGATIHEAWQKMFSEWLPGSGYQTGDSPSLELYEADFKSDEATGEFTCWLCVPIKPL